MIPQDVLDFAGFEGVKLLIIGFLRSGRFLVCIIWMSILYFVFLSTTLILFLFLCFTQAVDNHLEALI
jgi:hypothetical protein